MPSRSIIALVSLALTGVLVGSCDRKSPVNGVAGFEIGKTLLGPVAAKYVCGNQGEQTRCHAGSLRLGGRQAVVELWFEGKQNATPLAEILLDIPGCRLDAVATELVEKVGEPSKQGDERFFWAQKYVFIAAREVAPSRCEVVFVSPQDGRRIAQLER